MADKPKVKMGRPVLYEDKSLKLTFLLDQASTKTIDEEAERLVCSRSDALVDIIRHFRSCRRRSR